MIAGTLFQVFLGQVNPGDVLIFSALPLAGLPSIQIPQNLLLEQGASGYFAVGTIFCAKESTKDVLQVTGRHFIQAQNGAMTEAVFMRCLCPLADAEYTLWRKKQGYSLAVITLSDKGAIGLREDESGPLVVSLVQTALSLHSTQCYVLPDDPAPLRALVTDLALHQGIDLVITTGGTGLTVRDTTPEALTPLFDRHLHGFTQAMMAVSLVKTPHAILSRAVAGIVGSSIVFTLPGSKKAVKENLEVLLPALDHALAKLRNDPTDCGN